jgi:hypothetical protein
MLSVLLIPFPFPGDVTLLITLFHSNYLFCQSAPRPRPMPLDLVEFELGWRRAIPFHGFDDLGDAGNPSLLPGHRNGNAHAPFTGSRI